VTADESTLKRVSALLVAFRELENSGASRSDHPSHEKRNQLLDELQDAVGLGGKMVMERDIVKRAERMLAGS
jgi:hypothetical protein